AIATATTAERPEWRKDMTHLRRVIVGRNSTESARVSGPPIWEEKDKKSRTSHLGERGARHACVNLVCRKPRAGRCPGPFSSRVLRPIVVRSGPARFQAKISQRRQRIRQTMALGPRLNQ